MSHDSNPFQEFPPEVLAGNEHANSDPPQDWKVGRTDDRDPPWYDQFLDDSCRSDSVMFSFRGKTRFLTPDELRRMRLFLAIVGSPLFFIALPLRLFDRILRWAHILPPLSYLGKCTPLDSAINILFLLSIRFGEVHVERSGQVLLGHERRSGPCIHKPALTAIKRLLSSYPIPAEIQTGEHSDVGAGHWRIHISNPMGDAISLVAAPFEAA